MQPRYQLFVFVALIAFSGACRGTQGDLGPDAGMLADADMAMPADANEPEEVDAMTMPSPDAGGTGDGPEAYWEGVDLSLEGQALIGTLQEHLKKHHQVISYGGLKAAYLVTDAMHSECPSGMIFDVYSSKCWDSAVACGNYKQEGDCFNREHSWPKSWFGGGGSAYSDIVQVIPSDGYVNGKRSNFIFGEVATATYTSTNGSRLGSCLKPESDITCFEPIVSLRGDFARIYFYMATRYEGELIGSSLAVSGSDLNFATEELMRDWHESDPVSDDERRRNDGIEQVQNSRNPYVDYPELVSQISDF